MVYKCLDRKGGQPGAGIAEKQQMHINYTTTLNGCFVNTAFDLNIPAIEHSHSSFQNTDTMVAIVNSFNKHSSNEIGHVT